MGKLIAFYLDDYVLFKRKLPVWICSFIQIEGVMVRIEAVVGIYEKKNLKMIGKENKEILLEKERNILFGIDENLHDGHLEDDILKQIDSENLLSFGKTSIWNERTSEMERNNVSERNAVLGEKFRRNTKMKCFYNLLLNFDKSNIIDSILNFKFIPFYKYKEHINNLKKFNLHSSEVSLYYLSEILKPIFLVIIGFTVMGFSGKFKRNENFFKVLFFFFMFLSQSYLFSDITLPLVRFYFDKFVNFFST